MSLEHYNKLLNEFRIVFVAMMIEMKHKRTRTDHHNWKIKSLCTTYEKYDPSKIGDKKMPFPSVSIQTGKAMRVIIGVKDIDQIEFLYNFFNLQKHGDTVAVLQYGTLV